MSRSSEGQCHSAACLWKGLDLSNNVCEYGSPTHPSGFH